MRVLVGLVLGLFTIAWSNAALSRSPESEPTFVVMLDPGHGGSNTGAPGIIEGVYEKRLTLLLGRAVARRLADEPGVKVQITREKDTYLTLGERVRRANQEQVNVFLSIHANASQSHRQEGFESYVLSADVLDVDARALRASVGPYRPGVGADSEVAAILDDVERAMAVPKAIRLAECVQKRLEEVRGAFRNRGIKPGNMDVLMGPIMPAVLVEVGFFDHPREGVELLTRDVRNQIANALARAIVDYRDQVRQELRASTGKTKDSRR